MIATTYDVVPSLQSATASGLQFSAAGGPLIMTNVGMSGPNRVNYDPPSVDRSGAISPLELSFAVAQGVPDPSGNITYQPDPAQVLLFVVDASRKVYVQGQFVANTLKVTKLGGTGYSFTGNVAVSGPGVAGASLTVAFDLSLPLGSQVTGGQLVEIPN